jgi:hypothetical protein
VRVLVSFVGNKVACALEHLAECSGHVEVMPPQMGSDLNVFMVMDVTIPKLLRPPFRQVQRSLFDCAFAHICSPEERTTLNSVTESHAKPRRVENRDNPPAGWVSRHT